MTKTQTMKLALYTEPLPPSFRWVPTNPWRGTEEFYVQTATNLVALGHSVTVFYDGADTQLDGVDYVSRSRYRGGFDVVLCCNTPPPALLPGTKHVYWTNLYKDTIERHLWADAFVAISAFASDQFGVIDSDAGRRQAAVVPHGLAPEDLQILPGPKEPIALYSSSMDRGGHMLKALWDSFGVKDLQGTPIRLVCTEGKLSNAEVRDLYRRSLLWLHPGLGVELFCISALKAKAAGCLCLYSPVMALGETIGQQSGHVALGSLFWKRRAAGLVREALESGKYKSEEAQISGVGLPSWLTVTTKLESVLKSV